MKIRRGLCHNCFETVLIPFRNHFGESPPLSSASPLFPLVRAADGVASEWMKLGGRAEPATKLGSRSQPLPLREGGGGPLAFILSLGYSLYLKVDDYGEPA